MFLCMSIYKMVVICFKILIFVTIDTTLLYCMKPLHLPRVQGRKT